MLSVLVRTGKELHEATTLASISPPDTRTFCSTAQLGLLLSEEGLEEPRLPSFPSLLRHTGRTVCEKGLDGPLGWPCFLDLRCLTSAGDASSGAEGKPPGRPRALLTPQWVCHPCVLPALGIPEPPCALGPQELCLQGMTVNTSSVPDAQ